MSSLDRRDSNLSRFAGVPAPRHRDSGIRRLLHTVSTLTPRAGVWEKSNFLPSLPCGSHWTG